MYEPDAGAIVAPELAVVDVEPEDAVEDTELSSMDDDGVA